MKPTLRDWLVLGEMLALLAGAVVTAEHGHENIGAALAVACLLLDRIDRHRP